MSKEKPLAEKNFILFLMGSFISLWGDWIYQLSITIWIVSKTNSPMSLMLSVLISKIPKIVIGAIGGAFIDNWSKKKTMVSLDVLQGLICLIAASVILNENLSINARVYCIYCTTLLLSSCSALFEPAKNSLLPLITERENIKKANTVIASATNIATLSSFLISIVMISLFGCSMAIFINGITFLASALLTSFIYSTEIIYNTYERKIFFHQIKNYYDEMKDVLFVIGQDAGNLVILSSGGIIYFFIVPILWIIFPFIIVDCFLNSGNVGMLTFFGINPSQGGLAFFRSIYGVAATCGGIWASFKYQKIAKRFHDVKIIQKCILVIGLTFAFVSFFYSPFSYNNLPILLLLLAMVFSAFSISFSVVIAEITVRSWIQLKIPKEFHGRSFSLVNVFAECFICLGLVIIGLISSWAYSKSVLYTYYLASGLLIIFQWWCVRRLLPASNIHVMQ